MKVGVVTTSYPRFPDDPAGNFVGEHVRALRELGHEVEVIAADDELSAPRSARTNRHADGDRDHDATIEPIAIRVPSRGLFYTSGAPDLLEQDPRRAIDAAMFSLRLTAAVVRRRWDSIVAHWLAPSALACLPTSAPLLAIAHGGDVHMLRRVGLLAPALHLLRARDAQLVFVSEELRALSIAAAPRLARWLAGARVQPMGIDVARFTSIPREPTTPPTIAIVARLVPIKGVDVAIAAFRLLRHRARLVIAGSGPEMRDLVHAAYGRAGSRPANVVVYTRREMAELEEQHGIGFRMAIDTRARDELLSRASLVLVPSRIVGPGIDLRGQRSGSDMDASIDFDAGARSGRSEAARAGRSEGTPLVALEALAAGVPVIASDVGGLRDLARVICVPPDDPRALAEAIDRVLDAPPASDALRESVAHLDWRRVVGTLVRTP